MDGRWPVRRSRAGAVLCLGTGTGRCRSWSLRRRIDARGKRSTLAMIGVALVVLLPPPAARAEAARARAAVASSGSSSQPPVPVSGTGLTQPTSPQRHQAVGRDGVLHRGLGRAADVHLPDVRLRGVHDDEQQPADEHDVPAAVLVRRQLPPDGRLQLFDRPGAGTSNGGKTFTIEAETVQVVQRRDRDRARSGVLDERHEGLARDGVVRVRARVLPGQRDELLGAEPVDVRAELQGGLQPGLVDQQRAVAAHAAANGLGPHVAVGLFCDVPDSRQHQQPAGYDQSRRGSGV